MPTSPTSRFIEINGMRLHAACWGDPGRPVAILLHGMRDHARSWDWIAGALAAEYHVIAPDLRGHGDSGWSAPAGYSVAAFVLDLEDWVAAIGPRRVHLIGHSFGGAIALRYAAAYPERVQALCAIEAIELPIIRDEQQAPKPFPARLRDWIDAERRDRERSPRPYASVGEAVERMVAAHPELDRDTLTHLAEHGVVREADGSWRWKFDNAVRRRPPDDADGRDLDQCLDAIACPALLFYGEKSWIPLPASARLARLRTHRIVQVPEASHWLHHQARDRFLGELRSFLQATTESPLHA